MIDNRYQQCLIYKLSCCDPNITDIYIGHTIHKFGRRRRHKYNCNNLNSNKYNSYLYQFIRNHNGWDNWDFIVIEEFPCESKFEAETRERYWIQEHNPSLNQQLPTRTKQEYRQECKLLGKKQLGKERFGKRIFLN